MADDEGTIHPARRLTLMVRELHRRGLERLAVYPHIGDSGAFRYILTSLDDPRGGRTGDAASTLTVWESFGAGGLPWDSRPDADAGALADAFERKYPALVGAARGESRVAAISLPLLPLNSCCQVMSMLSRLGCDGQTEAWSIGGMAEKGYSDFLRYG